MDLNVVAFRPADELWKKHKAVWDACRTAGVPVPRSTEQFFNDTEPDEAGVRIDIPVREWRDRDGDCSGYELNVADIPKNVSVIRFYGAW